MTHWRRLVARPAIQRATILFLFLGSDLSAHAGSTRDCATTAQQHANEFLRALCWDSKNTSRTIVVGNDMKLASLGTGNIDCASAASRRPRARVSAEDLGRPVRVSPSELRQSAFGRYGLNERGVALRGATYIQTLRFSGESQIEDSDAQRRRSEVSFLLDSNRRILAIHTRWQELDPRGNSVESGVASESLAVYSHDTGSSCSLEIYAPNLKSGDQISNPALRECENARATFGEALWSAPGWSVPPQSSNRFVMNWTLFESAYDKGKCDLGEADRHYGARHGAEQYFLNSSSVPDSQVAQIYSRLEHLPLAIQRDYAELPCVGFKVSAERVAVSRELQRWKGLCLHYENFMSQKTQPQQRSTRSTPINAEGAAKTR